MAVRTMLPPQGPWLGIPPGLPPLPMPPGQQLAHSVTPGLRAWHRVTPAGVSGLGVEAGARLSLCRCQ